MRRKRLRPWPVIVAVVAVVIAAAVYALVQLLGPVPAMTVAPAAAPMHALPGVPPRPAWPGQAEAAIGMAGVGMLASHGGDQPLPIASVAKIMTAYVILGDHPVSVGEPGPVITVTAADVAAYTQGKGQGQSVVKVVAGEKLTELQALEAMLIPSGNNIASLLAGWDAGSPTAFVTKMNAQARALRLRDTRYADATGVDPGTVSTASDQFVLAVHALQIPVFRQIVAMPQVTLPAAGVAYNVNSALGQDGIVGVKTGSTPQAGGCLVFSAIKTVAGAQATIVGAVLGVQPTAAQPSELAAVISATKSLLDSVSGDLENTEVVRTGTVLATVHSAWTTGPPAVALSSVSVTGWPGVPVTLAVTPRTLAQTVRQGQPVALATVTVGSEINRITLHANGAVQPPSLRWRLTSP